MLGKKKTAGVLREEGDSKAWVSLKDLQVSVPVESLHELLLWLSSNQGIEFCHIYVGCDSLSPVRHRVGLGNLGQALGLRPA